MRPHLTLVCCIIFLSNQHKSISAAITFTSCWQLYRQPFSRTPFLTEHINRRLTFSVFIIQSEEKKRNSKGLLTNTKIIFLIWNSRYKYSTPKILFIHTYYYWNNKHGNVKENVSCASSVSYQFVKYLLWHQNYSGMDYPPPPLPPTMPYPLIDI